jgi:hypothetical protein
MDTAALRQAFAAVPVQVARPDPFVARGAVPTELPAVQSVGSAWDGSAVRTDLPQNPAALSRLAQAMQRTTEQRFERDRKTDTLVYKQVDPKTGEVLLQLPDQSLLNLRAYLKQVQDNAPARVRTSA